MRPTSHLARRVLAALPAVAAGHADRGTPEESHFYLGTENLDILQLGIAVDQALPYGPRVCQ